MRKTLLLSLATTISLMAAPSNNTKIEDIQKMNFFKNKGITILGTKAIDDMTMVSVMAQTPQGAQKMSVFITGDKKHVIIGGGYVDQTGEQLTVPMDMTSYKKDAGITIGNGKKELYVFTDPECPFCIKMDKEVLSSLSTKEYTIRVYMFPLSFHQNAESMSMYILSQKTDVEKMNALHAISNGSKEYQNASYTEADRTKIKNMLSKQMQIAQSLGVNGTPTLFDEKGNPVNWMALGSKK